MTKTAAEIRDDLKKRRTKRGKNSWYKVKPGTKTYLRIGPPWKPNGEFWKDVLFHGRYGNKVYCRRNDVDEKTGKKKKCPVCVRVAELKTDRSPFGKKLWTLIKQNSEGLWNVLAAEKFKKTESGKIIVRKYEQDKFQILRLSPKWQNIMMDIFADEDYRTKHIQGVTHSKYGRLIKAGREGSGRDDTVYTFVPVDHESAIFKEKEDRQKILKTLIDLDAVVRGSSQEECEAFLEKAEKKAKKMARLEKEDKDEEEEDDDEDGEDKEEKDEEDDEEDSEEDEGEDDEDSDDEDESESDGEDDGDDDELERKYKKMKKGLKKKKKAKDDDEDDD